MKPKPTLILILILLLTACSPAQAAEPDTASSPTAPEIALEPTATPLPSPTPEPAPFAAFTEVLDPVDSRESPSADFSPAAVGLDLPLGGQAQTYEDGRAALELSYDASIIRLSGNTLFTFLEADPQEDDPLSRLNLVFGQLWIILNQGSIFIDTPAGNASVRGSLMSVFRDRDLGFIYVTCLEGNCATSNDLGTTEFTAGQAVLIPGADFPPSDPLPMQESDFLQWQIEVPEAAPFIPTDFAPPDDLVAGPGISPDEVFPIFYELTNDCPSFAWNVRFEGPVNETFSIPANGSVTGELPPGVYSVSSWALDAAPYPMLDDLTGNAGSHPFIASHDCEGFDD